MEINIIENGERIKIFSSTCNPKYLTRKFFNEIMASMWYSASMKSSIIAIIVFYQLWMIVVIGISSQIGSTNKDFSQILKDWDKYRVMNKGIWSFTDDFMSRGCMSGFSQVSFMSGFSHFYRIFKWNWYPKMRKNCER